MKELSELQKLNNFVDDDTFIEDVCKVKQVEKETISMKRHCLFNILFYVNTILRIFENISLLFHHFTHITNSTSNVYTVRCCLAD